MSPRRVLENDIIENNLKERVSACRKRVRRNRLTQTAVGPNHTDEGFPETTTSAAELHDHRADAGIPKDTVRIDYSTIEFESTEPIDRELWLLVGEQEVGIT